MAGTEQLMNMTQQQGKTEHRLYVGDLDENCNETILKQNFSQFGAIKALVNKAKKKRFPNETVDRFYGIVYLASEEELQRAKDHMDQQVIMNNRIRVCLYKNYFDRVETDVYLRGVKGLQSHQVKPVFDRYGPVFSVKIAQEKQTGAGLNYGYLSFSDKESRDKCLLALKGVDVDIQGKLVSVSPFTPYNKRTKNLTNIYMKNLPGPSQGMSLQQVQEYLQEKANQAGEVSSMLVKYDESFQKHFAFVCYKDTQAAEKAFQALGQLQFKELKVEVNWAMKKDERHAQNYQNLKCNLKKTNIYMKNLLEEVEEETLVKIFSEHGHITSHKIVTPKYTPSHINTKTKFAFINYQQESMAQSLLNKVKSQDLPADLKALFLNQEPSIMLFKPKDQLAKHKQHQKPQLSQQNIMQMMQQMSSNPAMFYQTMQQMMMMNMMMLKQGAVQRPNMQQSFPKNIMPKPNMQIPNMQMPGMQMPGMQMPGMQMPGMQMPGMQMAMHQVPMQMSGMGNVNINNQNINRVNQTPQPQPNMMATKMTASSLKENLSEFLKQDHEKQRALLGELLFPLVGKYAEVADQAPKITGMLIDFEVFEVSEILEFLENEELLKERIKEAEELIENTANN